MLPKPSPEGGGGGEIELCPSAREAQPPGGTRLNQYGCFSVRLFPRPPPPVGGGCTLLRPKSPRRLGEEEESSSAPRLGRPSLRGGRDSTFLSATLARTRTSGAAVVRGGTASGSDRAGGIPNPNPSIHRDIIRPRAGG